MKQHLVVLAAALSTVAGGAQAALTPSTTYSDVFGASTPTDALAVGVDSFINGVSASAGGTVTNGVFTDVVSGAGGGHVTTTFSFGQDITAFGGVWNLVYPNSGISGSGLQVDIGSDGSYELTIPTSNAGFWGVKSDTAFDTFKVAYIIGNDPYQESYQLSNFQFTAAVPEPETYAMLLAGLGVLSFTARRRKSA